MKFDKKDRALVDLASRVELDGKFDCENETEIDVLKSINKVLTCYLGVNPNLNHTSTTSIEILSYRLLHTIKGVADMRGYGLTSNGLKPVKE